MGTLDEELSTWIFNGDIEKVIMALKSIENLNGLNSNGMTALMLAVEGDQPAILELLLSKGISPDETNSEGWTTLHLAVEYAIDGMIQNNDKTPDDDVIECIHLLLKYGIDKKKENDKGKSAFDYDKNDIVSNSLKVFIAKKQ